jgi:ribonuclease PH
MIERIDRDFRTIRPVEMVVGFHRLSEGSVLYRAGGTVVLATASVDESVPEFMKGQGKGWVTAEYQMHPRSNPKKRESRDGRGRAVSGRTQEIQRLVGRALRAALDLEKLGERSIVIDCDVLEADGGTRTASISAGWVALVLALSKLEAAKKLERKPLRDQVGAISVGIVDEQLLLDLCYIEDSHARVDLNVVATSRGGIVEIQGTAEGEAVPRSQIDRMVDLGLEGIAMVGRAQREALAFAGVDWSKLAEGALFE